LKVRYWPEAAIRSDRSRSSAIRSEAVVQQM
jgi:hypothetical protein